MELLFADSTNGKDADSEVEWNAADNSCGTYLSPTGGFAYLNRSNVGHNRNEAPSVVRHVITVGHDERRFDNFTFNWTCNHVSGAVGPS